MKLKSGLKKRYSTKYNFFIIKLKKTTKNNKRAFNKFFVKKPKQSTLQNNEAETSAPILKLRLNKKRRLSPSN
jgi:hypothetical protein